MLIRDDPDEYETVSKYRTCIFHQQHPGEPYAGCTCSASISYRRRPASDIAAIKAERRRKEEDRILAEAGAIKARRGA